jgi:hypothetical protein
MVGVAWVVDGALRVAGEVVDKGLVVDDAAPDRSLPPLDFAVAVPGALRL